jgi:hypothetical protein
MNFGITLETESSIYKKTAVVRELSRIIKEFLSDKNYGNGVQHMFIGIICKKERAGYEDWYKPRKPKYKSEESIEYAVGKFKKNYNIFTYDVKLNYEAFKIKNEETRFQYLAQSLLKSFDNLDSLPKKIKDFDKEKFKLDLASFLKEQGIPPRE